RLDRVVAAVADIEEVVRRGRHEAIFQVLQEQPPSRWSRGATRGRTHASVSAATKPRGETHGSVSFSEAVCAILKGHGPGAQTERRGDAGPVRGLLGGRPSPATFLNSA